jgi:hypothetical protein
MKLECEAFLASLDNRRPPVSDGEEELQALEVLEACERSLSDDGVRTAITLSTPRLLLCEANGRFDDKQLQPTLAGLIGTPA